MSVFTRAGAVRCDGQGAQEELQQRLTKAAESWERPRKRLAQSIGQYEEDSGAVRLQRVKGKMIQTMGKFYVERAEVFTDGGGHGYLVLFRGTSSESAMALSVQESLELMVMNGVSLERYLIYSDLKSNGHVTFRHPVNLSLSKEDSPRDIWPTWNPQSAATHDKQPTLIYVVFGTASEFSRSRLGFPERCIVHIPNQQLRCAELTEIESTAAAPCVYAFEINTEVMYYTLDSVPCVS